MASIGFRFVFVASAVLGGLLAGCASKPETPSTARFVAFNIWGDFFGNPPHERDLLQAEILKEHDPDFIGLQEMTPGFWKSRLIGALSDTYGVVGEGMDVEGMNAADPVFYRKSRFELVEKGATWFCKELDKSKGAVWAVFREKATGKRIAVFASHFWWQEKGSADKFVRLLNARQLHDTLTEVARRHDAAIVGGGDLNSPLDSWGLAHLVRSGWADAQRSAPETDARATWRDFPVRDAQGVYRGVQPEQAKRQQWLDHVFYTPERVTPIRFALDRRQKALDVSDHSPIIFDFTF